MGTDEIYNYFLFFLKMSTSLIRTLLKSEVKPIILRIIIPYGEFDFEKKL